MTLNRECFVSVLFCFFCFKDGAWDTFRFRGRMCDTGREREWVESTCGPLTLEQDNRCAGCRTVQREDLCILRSAL